MLRKIKKQGPPRGIKGGVFRSSHLAAPARSPGDVYALSALALRVFAFVHLKSVYSLYLISVAEEEVGPGAGGSLRAADKCLCLDRDWPGLRADCRTL